MGAMGRAEVRNIVNAVMERGVGAEVRNIIDAILGGGLRSSRQYSLNEHVFDDRPQSLRPGYHHHRHGIPNCRE